jgi:hypothetical protein
MAGTKIEAIVTMKNVYSYEAPAYGYGYETRRIYTMQAEDGTVYVWKTAACMCEQIPQTDEREIELGNKWSYSPVNKGDVIRIKASVKGYGEYNGQPQTELTRVKVLERTFKAKTLEDIQREKQEAQERKAREQMDSLQGEDFVWQMPYKQYKDHYGDCETVAGSFIPADPERRRYAALITVIVREGRLKASGVRGEHYSGYRLENADGKQVVYRAVKEENAIRRAEKEFGGTWKCVKVYYYDRY